MCNEQKDSGINIEKVQEIIEKVAKDFRENERIILTEHDLQWRICHYLQQNKDMKREGCLNDKCWDPNNKYEIYTEIIWDKLKDEYEGLEQVNIQLLKDERIIKENVNLIFRCFIEMT